MANDISNLEVYQLALLLLEKLYILLKRLPISEYDTCKQIKRSAKSIPANIAEGFAKRSSGPEFKRFLRIALGSSDETKTHLQIISITTPRLKTETESLGLEYKILSKKQQSDSEDSLIYSKKFWPTEHQPAN